MIWIPARADFKAYILSLFETCNGSILIAALRFWQDVEKADPDAQVPTVIDSPTSLRLVWPAAHVDFVPGDNGSYTLLRDHWRGMTGPIPDPAWFAATIKHPRPELFDWPEKELWKRESAVYMRRPGRP